MNITNFVREKVKGLKEDFTRISNRHDFIEIISLVLAVGAIAVGGLCAFSAIWNITFPCIGFGAGMVSLNCANRKKSYARKDRIDHEIKHLENLSKKPFDVSREKYQKRARKAAALSKSLEAAQEKVDVSNVFDGLLTLGLIGTTAAGIILGGTVLCAVPMVIAAVKGINDIIGVKNVDKKELLQNRVENLEHDLELQTSLVPRQEVARAVPNLERNNTCNRSLSHTIDYSNDEIEAVDSYVEDLAKAPQEKAYQKVKC